MSKEIMQQAYDAMNDLEGYRPDIDKAMAAIRDELSKPEQPQTDLRKAVMQQALEALISYSNSPYIKKQHPVRYTNGNKAIATLEAELAKPVNEFAPDWDQIKPYHDRIAELEAQLSKQEQGEVVVSKNRHGQIVAVTRQDEDHHILKVIATSEPNFCQRCGKRLGDGIHTCTPPEQEQEQEQEPVAWMENSVELYVNDRPTSIYTIPLYTTPPKREWQGLTDEEIKNVWQEIKDAVCLDHQTFARAIEAKLREKNT